MRVPPENAANRFNPPTARGIAGERYAQPNRKRLPDKRKCQRQAAQLAPVSDDLLPPREVNFNCETEEM